MLQKTLSKVPFSFCLDNSVKKNNYQTMSASPLLSLHCLGKCIENWSRRLFVVLF